MNGKRKASVGGSLLVVVLVVVAAASSMSMARAGYEKAPTTCLNEYSKLCGKGKYRNASCATMVEKACNTETDKIAFIERLFVDLATVGKKKHEVYNLTTSGGQDALNESVDKHGACPGNIPVFEYSNQCDTDCDLTCMNASCSDHCYVDCLCIAARFCYIMATPANKKAIEKDMDCFKRCAKYGTNDKCRVACKLISSTLPPSPAPAA